MIETVGFTKITVRSSIFISSMNIIVCSAEMYFLPYPPPIPNDIIFCDNIGNDESKIQTSPIFKGRKGLSTSYRKSQFGSINDGLDVTNLRETNLDDDSWVSYKKQSLNSEHKNLILRNGKICSDVMNFASSIIKDQYSVDGLQNTGNAPFLNEFDKWEYALTFKSMKSIPSAQIHHTGKDHWVLSILHENDVYVIDSLMSRISVITASMEIQLAKLYETRRVILPNVQQQQNSVDCGIFAIAFLVELCANGFNNLINSTFDVSEMRNHLSVCIENKHFQPFPKTQDNVKPKRSNPIIYEIEADCNSCTLPNIFDDMIGCENGDCEFWYHMKCVDINKTISDSLKFICDHCNEPLT